MPAAGMGASGPDKAMANPAALPANLPPPSWGAPLAGDAADAAAGRDIGRLLDLVRQVANLDPVRAEALAASPAFASHRTQVEQLLAQLTAAAKLHAEGRLANATQMVETGTLRDKSAG